MAMISTLRKHSWIVLVFIALSLIGFLLMDAFNSNSGLVNENRRQTFAEIDGSEITYQLDATKYKWVLTQYLTQTQQLLITRQEPSPWTIRQNSSCVSRPGMIFTTSNIHEPSAGAAGLHVTEQEDQSDLRTGSHPYIRTTMLD